MKKLLIVIFLINFIILSAYSIHYSNEFKIKKYLNPFLKKHNFNFEKICILEADNLNEFTVITKLPYSYTAGAYIQNKDEKDYIVILPIYILKKKGIFEKTIVHEMLHHYLTKYFKMPGPYQEQFIKNYLKKF
ncbi:hypothetical protein OSSY52_21150 [Tepiditoga spiralis]|uniref:Uncharacterized protein n=1 Tax=Tepiditoga spiralis TaxID=2108365 RepID=A0A7G1G9P4_9BACT|nr:hypothetical protein [Tepiditoga spiralis]BBE31974.1 hypothetical protein OSSY52_21150 [Tepiditoga spiralis]